MSQRTTSRRLIATLAVALLSASPTLAHNVKATAKAFRYTRLHTSDNVGLVGAMSATGRYAAYAVAPGAETGLRTDLWQVYVRDLAMSAPELVSIGKDGAPPDGYASHPSLSADGRYVAFFSTASNLVPGDTNGACDVFLVDRLTQTIERVNVNSRGEQQLLVKLPTTTGSFEYCDLYTAISDDGRFVAFSSAAPNLVDDDTNGGVDFFVRDRQTGTTSRVSVSSSGEEAQPIKASPSAGVGRVAISADGRYVAFSHDAPNLVPGDENRSVDVFVHDRVTGETRMASVALDGRPPADANRESFLRGMSADASVVGFESYSPRLVPQDLDRAKNFFLRRLMDEYTQLVSVTSGGAPREPFSPLLSRDGSAAIWIEGTGTRVRDLAGGQTSVIPSIATVPLAISGDGRRTLHMLKTGIIDAIPARGVFVADEGDALETMVARTTDAPGGALGVDGVVTVPPVLAATKSDAEGDAIRPELSDADLAGASIHHLPEEDTVVLRWDVTHVTLSAPPLPGASGLAIGNARAPAVVYGAELVVAGTRWLLLQNVGDTFVADTIQFFTLYRCRSDCTYHTPVEGSAGETGQEVVAAIPLYVLGDHPSALESATLFSAQQSGTLMTPPQPLRLDDVSFGPVAVPPPDVSVALAELGEAPGPYRPARVHGRAFAASFDAGGGRNHDIHVRVCHAGTCRATVVRNV